jgi:hypothetical protein
LITTPSARAKVASQYLLTAHPPLLVEEGKPQTVIDFCRSQQLT